jgi:hypothetical protein
MQKRGMWCMIRARAPYLIHTGYELPLLLDGRKKLARMPDLYPPMRFDGEDRFDHWVAEGLLHREEVLEPFDSPVRGHLGDRLLHAEGRRVADTRQQADMGGFFESGRLERIF